MHSKNKKDRHTQQKIILPNSDTVIVFIHGILGTPNHFSEFEKKVPNGWSICNILLKGHGGSVKEFSKASMQDWKNQVINEVKNLTKNFDKIYLVAHSMGCLFSLYISDMFPNKIKGLFFLAPPLRITLRIPIVITSAKIIFEIECSDKSTLAAKKAYSINREKNVLKYIAWIPNFLSLFIESIKGRKYAKSLQTPCKIYMSKKDELVLLSSANYFEGNATTSIKILENSQHFYYEEKDFILLLEEFDLFCKKK